MCAKHRRSFEGVLAVVKRLLKNINAKFIFMGKRFPTNLFN